MPSKPVQPFLEVEHFAQIRKARIEFGDLTVLVGAQATGKSLLLQMLKLAIDGRAIAQLMANTGITWDSRMEFIGRFLGEGMESAWRYNATSVRSHKGRFKPWRPSVQSNESEEERLFYIPAHRALLLMDGWPLRFERLTESTPVVARLFSDALFRTLSTKSARTLSERLRGPFHDLVDEAIYHGGSLELVSRGIGTRLEMIPPGSETGIPLQVWATGQREFTPLLIGLRRMLPPGGVRRVPVKWVVIEEPEMGLHPRGIEVTLLLVLELLRREYRVVLSTHSPQVLEMVWGLQRLAERGARAKDLLEVFRLEKRRDLTPLAERALEASYRVFALEYVGDSVQARNITQLDPGSEDSVMAFWGGLTEFGSRIADVVTRLSR